MTDQRNDDPETGTQIQQKYDSNGLLTAVVTDDSNGDVLMVAFMNEEAFRLTIETNIAHFYSRSRQTLWKKGETSGNVLNVTEMRMDCDQDALWIKATPAGPTCHTGEKSCFYRKVVDGKLAPVS